MAWASESSTSVTMPTKAKSSTTMASREHRHFYLDPYNAVYNGLQEGSSVANMSCWPPYLSRQYTAVGQPLDQLVILHLSTATAYKMMRTYEHPQCIYDDVINRLEAPFRLQHTFIGSHTLKLFPISKPSAIFTGGSNIRIGPLSVCEYLTEEYED